MEQSVRPDEEVGHDPRSAARAPFAALPPQPSRGESRLKRQRLEPYAEEPERRREGIVRGEVRSYLRPDDIARDERAGVVGGAEGLPRSFAEARICTQHVE